MAGGSGSDDSGIGEGGRALHASRGPETPAASCLSVSLSLPAPAPAWGRTGRSPAVGGCREPLHSYGHSPAAPAEAAAGPGLGGRRAPLPQRPDRSVQAEQGPRGCYMWSPTAHLRWCGGVTLPCLWGNLRFQVTLGFGKVRRHFLSGSEARLLPDAAGWPLCPLGPSSPGSPPLLVLGLLRPPGLGAFDALPRRGVSSSGCRRPPLVGRPSHPPPPGPAHRLPGFTGLAAVSPLPDSSVLVCVCPSRRS